MHDLHAAYINDFSGRKAEAEVSYRAVLAAQENPSPRVVEAVGEFFERSGRIDDARALYLRYQAQSPDSTLAQRALNRIKDGPAPTPMRSASAGFAEALHNLAGVLRQENLGQNALIYGRLALALEPQMPAGLFLVADILDGQGQREAANALFERVPRDSAFDLAARMRVVENLHELGKTDAAIEGLNALAAAYPERVDPLVTLGNILRVKERFPEAVDAYGRAIDRLDRVEPRHWSLFYTRGIALERSKQWPRAEADFQRASSCSPSSRTCSTTSPIPGSSRGCISSARGRCSSAPCSCGRTTATSSTASAGCSTARASMSRRCPISSARSSCSPRTR
jgi:thioredoxin-like negative regulator of GroEL